ncbi:unnamed protein product [Schistosoma margrebowiei]|uniref:Uncharacterized protein n=1 Tax=Schistosoma margrebowiei TaxID=48269 RepID=A0A183M0U7_9TREM|nr:unnamed protein product [Schistosoma margrebowiei]
MKTSTYGLALLSHTHKQMQIKTASVAAVSASVGLNIHKGKTKVLKYNTENSNPITLDGETGICRILHIPVSSHLIHPDV